MVCRKVKQIDKFNNIHGMHYDSLKITTEQCLLLVCFRLLKRSFWTTMNKRKDEIETGLRRWFLKSLLTHQSRETSFLVFRLTQ